MSDSLRHYWIVLSLCLAPILQAGPRPEVPDPSSVSAYQDFWKTFEDYESHHRSLEQGKEFGSWDQLKHKWQYQETKQQTAQLDLLEEAARRYQEHLEKYPGASNAPYVKLNLAQILQKIGQLRELDSPGSGVDIRREALALLADVTQQHAAFDLMEETQYLRATLLESLGQKETALPIWKALAAQARQSLYGVHAHIAVGDHYFAKEKPKEALDAYQKGRKLLEKIEVEDSDYERLRLQYRITWAAYRAAELEICIATAQELLEPGRAFKQISVKRRVETDAVELLGDALFERDNLTETKSTLQKTMLRPYAGAIGLRVMSKLVSMPTRDKLIDLGQFLVERYPQAKEMPDILTLLADTYREQKRDEDYLVTLERLSLMLPRTSLWRAQHGSDVAIMQNMETKAMAATRLLAASYYEQGMVQGTPSHFQTAQTFYDNLLAFAPQDPEAETWRLRRAHTLFFGGQWAKADGAYQDFIQGGKISSQNLEVAFYQQILSREKIWRGSLQKSLTGRGDPRQDPLVIENLRRLEQGIDDFADRFPGRQHLVDLLLLAASANRDLNEYAQAERYWNRSLLSDPSPAQRTLAIRGLVQAKIRTGSAQEIVALTHNYLKLENWKELGPTFGEEMRGVLSTALKSAGEELNKKGQVLEAGQLLLAVTEEFPSLPDYDTLYRDGSYYLAIAGSWGESQQAADRYLARSSRSKEADMLYLQARSLEYQMRFAEAARSHLQLGERFPRYAKSSQSVQKAEQLAQAEQEYKIAGRAALAVAAFQKDSNQRYASLVRASEHFEKEKLWDEALGALQSADKIARNTSNRYQTQLMIAKLHQAKGDEDRAIEVYQRLVQDTLKKQENIDATVVQKVAGEANFLLAEHERRSYDQYDLLSGPGALADRIEAKAQKFEKSLQYYNQAIQSRDPEWSSRARYGAGQLAENLAQTIKNALAKDERAAPGAGQFALEEQSKRLQSLAQQYYSQNLLARQREPHRFKDSVWIERSAMKVAGFNRSSDLDDREAAVPTSLGPSQPLQWSH
jgi:tetratricopeptide (TPR) repeat protein